MLLAASLHSGISHQLPKSQSTKSSVKEKDSSSAHMQDAPSQGLTNGHKHQQPSTSSKRHQYQSLADEMRDVQFKHDHEQISPVLSKTKFRTAKAHSSSHLEIKKLQKIPRKELSDPHGTAGGFEPIYPYPENKDIIVWRTKDPKTAMTTTISTLDTRPNSDSRSRMSQTRRMMDEKMEQRRRDVLRDLSGQLAKQESSQPELLKKSSNSSIRSSKEKAADTSILSDLRRSPENNSRHHPSRKSSSSASPPTQHNQAPPSPPLKSSLKRSSRSSYSMDSFDKRLSAGKTHLQRILSLPGFEPNPRGIAPTPSPDVSLELTLSQSDTRRKKHSMQIRERMKQYEMQLDQRIQAVQTNNRRLMELKSLLEHQSQAVVLHNPGRDDNNSNDDDDDDDIEWVEDQLDQGLRAQWEEAQILLEESQILQQHMREDLEREREANKQLESRMQGMSNQLKELVELSENQNVELNQVRELATKEREQLEKQLSEERGKQEQLQLALAKEKEALEGATRRKSSDQAEFRKLQLDITSLKQQLEAKEDELQRHKDDTELLAIKHSERLKEFEDHIQSLEKRLETEKDRFSQDQEARTRVRWRVNELAQSVEQKEDEMNELRSMLEERDELLEARQHELEEALALVHSLEGRLREEQVEAEESQQQEQEQHLKEIRQHRTELRDIRLKLAGERESSRQLENRIKLLLESHQETSQLNESKIQQLEEELEKRTLQLSQSSSSSSSATNTIHKLQLQIDDQERALMEKEDRIQELEQELKSAQQQAQNVVADLELDLLELENERSRLDSLLQKAQQQSKEDQMKVADLEVQLDHKNQELNLELDQRQGQEKMLLEKLMEEIESEETEDLVNDQLRESDYGPDDGSIEYIYSRLQEKIRELKLERFYQDKSLVGMRVKLGQFDGEIEAQQAQLTQAENDRKGLEEQLRHLQDQLAQAVDEQQQLRQQLENKESQLKENIKEDKSISNGSMSRSNSQNGQLSMSTSSRRHADQRDKEKIKRLSTQVEGLEAQIATLEQEKQQLSEQLISTQEQLQAMDETIQDQGEAAKSIRAKYTERIVALQRELVKHRKMVVKQEGQMFLYLSVIEKLKLQLRGTKVEQ
ncbi:hypothetical protein BX616_010920 [Lobosporangium transversale]|uniref:Uncharacterized protein n=1 Tax=Lobosporangium transversale TaxID=64571 RepID=A0A1Y2GNN8_9FUNG|nr:hypothetical protein BCR41DRAFT_387266 [Lobosporangium transversale]KAF9910221.1 hypothetical protein BX616_010920 [Lobosporangium transversale]ORZ12874.1 hypothetical protein BCR41DRAFT_387266 [Lobosporangium transversale]|eukprot:XP_021880223.1 hypothetical protein BCR41DRAFT_387266 [Lobosporangium transversale]